MQWVDRGPEPDGVAGYARQFTQGWVNHFRHQIGGRPTDSFWREFRSNLAGRSDGVCWYCERRCEPASETGGKAATVDHFRPLSRCPELAYEWTNWVFSCRRCNEENKQGKWPALGYIDPCAPETPRRPERYLDYDIDTGEIIPRKELTGDDRRLAMDTIEDLGLNKIDVRYYRLDWTRRFIADLLALPDGQRQDFVDFAFDSPLEYAGSTGMAVAQLRASNEL